jgi:hypothetical protein
MNPVTETADTGERLASLVIVYSLKVHYVQNIQRQFAIIIDSSRSVP